MKRIVQEPLKLGELFAGYGGLGMAVEEVFGAETTWFSEFEVAPSKILAHRWPGVPNYGDVTRIDWASVEPVDIISGGSPCQDLSLAGKRKGMTEGTRSNLWESMREGIATIRPSYVVWENVRGALSAKAISEMEQSEGRVGEVRGSSLRALGRVLGDLADLGYDCQWRGLRAADVEATHGRFRVFLLASLPDARGFGLEAGRLPGGQVEEIPEPPNYQQVLQDADCPTCGQRWQPAPGQAQGGRSRADAGGRSGALAADSQGIGWGQGWPEHARLEGGLDASLSSNQDWGEYAAAVERWERVNGPAPRPTEPTGRNGGHRLNPAFVEWMMGLPAGWVTEVPGVNRNAQIKALGNGVVPQQARAALMDMLNAFEAQRAAA